MKAGIKKYLVFELFGERMALEMGQVSEIIKAQPLTPVPLAKPDLLGVFNHRGLVLPLFDLSPHLFIDGRRRVDPEAITRFLVVGQGPAAVGLAVERILEFMMIPEEKVGKTPPDLPGFNQACLFGWTLPGDENERILLLDLVQIRFWADEKELTDRHFQNEYFDQAQTGPEEKKVETQTILTFMAGGKELAVDMLDVSEVVKLSVVTPLAGGKGRANLQALVRDKLVHLFELTSLLGMDSRIPERSPLKRPVLMVQFQQGMVGLMVDEVGEILGINPAGMERDPSVLAGFGREISAVIQPGRGYGLILMLNPFLLETAIDWPYLSGCILKHQAEALMNEQEVRTTGQREKFLLFTLHHEGFALPVSMIEAISVLKDLTPVPDAPEHLAGMTQIRGVIYGVSDMRKRLGLPSVSQDAAALLEQVSALSFDEELERLLVERIRYRGVGFRSCRLLLDDVRVGGVSRAISLQTFEQALKREGEQIEQTPRILLLSGPGARAIIVDTVLTVAEVPLDEIMKAVETSSDSFEETRFPGRFFVETLGQTFKIPNLDLLLGQDQGQREAE